MTSLTKKIHKFIKESNAIEGEPYEADTESVMAFTYLILLDVITGENLCHVHGILMNKKDVPFNQKGMFRTEPVFIAGILKDNMYGIPNKVSRILNIISADKNPSLDQMIKDHIKFERIHPFIDGNGRLGRLLFLWQQIKAGKEDLYAIEEAKKYEYYRIFSGEKVPKENYLSIIY